MIAIDVEEVFTSTINEGSLYDARLKQAFLDRFEHNTLDASSGALIWVSLAGTALRAYTRQHGSFRYTVRDRLALALKLSDYYADHVSEFLPAERIATAKRLGLPGLRTEG